MESKINNLFRMKILIYMIFKQKPYLIILILVIIILILAIINDKNIPQFIQSDIPAIT